MLEVASPNIDLNSAMALAISSSFHWFSFSPAFLNDFPFFTNGELMDGCEHTASTGDVILSLAWQEILDSVLLFAGGCDCVTLLLERITHTNYNLLVQGINGKIHDCNDISQSEVQISILSVPSVSL